MVHHSKNTKVLQLLLFNRKKQKELVHTFASLWQKNISNINHQVILILPPHQKCLTGDLNLICDPCVVYFNWLTLLRNKEVNNLIIIIMERHKTSCYQKFLFQLWLIIFVICIGYVSGVAECMCKYLIILQLLHTYLVK